MRCHRRCQIELLDARETTPSDLLHQLVPGVGMLQHEPSFIKVSLWI